MLLHPHIGSALLLPSFYFECNLKLARCILVGIHIVWSNATQQKSYLCHFASIYLLYQWCCCWATTLSVYACVSVCVSTEECYAWIIIYTRAERLKLGEEEKRKKCESEWMNAIGATDDELQKDECIDHESIINDSNWLNVWRCERDFVLYKSAQCTTRMRNRREKKLWQREQRDSCNLLNNNGQQQQQQQHQIPDISSWKDTFENNILFICKFYFITHCICMEKL